MVDISPSPSPLEAAVDITLCTSINFICLNKHKRVRGVGGRWFYMCGAPRDFVSDCDFCCKTLNVWINLDMESKIDEQINPISIDQFVYIVYLRHRNSLSLSLSESIHVFFMLTIYIYICFVCICWLATLIGIEKGEDGVRDHQLFGRCKQRPEWNR